MVTKKNFLSEKEEVKKTAKKEAKCKEGVDQNVFLVSRHEGICRTYNIVNNRTYY